MSKTHSSDKVHFIYKTTCLATGRYYVGMHSTAGIDDGYLGSGELLQRSLKKYGRENHRREILVYALNRAELIELEKSAVTLDSLNDPLCMNLAPGGRGGFDPKIFARRAEAVASSFEQRLELHRKLHLAYSSGGFAAVQALGYGKSRSSLLIAFKALLPEYVPHKGKTRSGKKRAQPTKSLEGTGICEDSWDLLFKLYNESVLTLPKKTACRVAYLRVLELYPQTTLSFAQVQTLTLKYAKFGRTLKEHALAKST